MELRKKNRTMFSTAIMDFDEMLIAVAILETIAIAGAIVALVFCRSASVACRSAATEAHDAANAARSAASAASTAILAISASLNWPPASN